ncbi:MAG: HAD family hydrolase [Burkholderiales bacterium]
MIKAVLFDFDGTLADTAPDLGAALNTLRTQRGLTALDPAAIRPHASHGARGLLKFGFDITQQDPDYVHMRERFLAIYAENLYVHTRLFPQAAELLRALQSRELKWGIVTNKPLRYTHPLIEKLNLGEAGCVVCGDSVENAKPHPESLLRASELLGVPAPDCVYVGDARRDIEAALAAGMRAVVARYGYLGTEDAPETWQAHGAIDTPLQLLDYLKLADTIE